ncbi:MAG TPA: sugar phosphate isomerase/epimerase [Victivallales bacterium]|mgnify:CR=1 FL=1|nr:sugar phosphate isomerase/epimerase [Victivallales bacterium]HPO90933.1 sugar phosphate isomerase/epimerase [Victivallales bacterium]HRR29152.1 sugar phosphate isomerase/epimerase [Victivallales bacterium]HRU01351.1 sugar phosphate isomerase/epimerase [Victivallales bacterium]
MKLKPISVQLYSVREEAKNDFVGVLKKIAKIGYKGVEPAGFHNLKPAEFRKIVEDLGMQISSSHGPWANPNNLNEVIDTAKILGIDLVSSGYGTEEFKNLDAIKRTADTVNGMVEVLSKAGITLFLHNHWWEFCRVNGRIAYDIFAELCPDVKFEIDTYWAANFGENDPAEQVAKFAKRTVLLHIKDGPLEKDKAMVAVGKGKMNFKKVIPAADPKVLRWLVVELDKCDTDMMEAIEQSYKYLVENKLGYGNK